MLLSSAIPTLFSSSFVFSVQEGYEYQLFHEMLLEDGPDLPEQISFEVHWGTYTPVTWWHRQKTAGELALFSRQLYEGGYRVISREDNAICPHCTELTVIRFRCPPAPTSMQAKLAASLSSEERTNIIA